MAEKSVDILTKLAFERGDIVRVPTGYKLSVAAVAALTIAVSELVRRWIYKGIKKETDPLDEDDPSGFHLRNEIIWKLARSVIIPIGYLKWRLGNLVLAGKENVEQALESGKGTQVIGNHISSMDTFIPQTALWFHGFRELAEERFRYVIGMKFVNRRPLVSAILKGGSYTPIVPPSMLELSFQRHLSKEERERHQENWKRINSIAFDWLREVLEQKYWSFIFPEGTRVEDGEMKKIKDQSAVTFRHPGSNLLPMAIIGTDKMWRPGSWRPNPLSKVTVIFGEPIPYEVVEAQAKSISIEYGVSEDRALCDIVMCKIALLMIENGHPEYAGFYGKPFFERLGIDQ